MVLTTKKWRRKNTTEKFVKIFFNTKLAIYLFLGLYKGRPSYRKRLKPSKENNQHFKKWNLLTFFNFSGYFFSPRSGSGLRIRIQGPHWLRIQSGSGSTTLISDWWAITTIILDIPHIHSIIRNAREEIVFPKNRSLLKKIIEKTGSLCRLLTYFREISVMMLFNVFFFGKKS